MGGGRKTGKGEAAGGAWTGVQRGFTTGEWNEAAGLARWAAARLEQRCFCWAAQLLLLLPFFSFLQTENKTEKHKYNGGVERDMRIFLESRNFLVFDKIELDIFRGTKIIQV